MSSQSGVKVGSAVTDEWAKIVADRANETRCMVLTIEEEQYKHLKTLEPKSSYQEDISLLLPSLSTEKTCASFAYRTDDKTGFGASATYDWVLITFVPDDAPVRQKMLHASSKAGLLKALGESRFKRTMFFTSPKDLTPSSFAAHLRHLDAPPPLSKSEQALAQIKIDEANEASNRLAALFGHPASSPSRGNSGDSLSPTGFRSPIGSPGAGTPPVGIGAMLSGSKSPVPGSSAVRTAKWAPEVEQKLKALLEGSETGKAVILQIDVKTETLTLKDSFEVAPGSLASKMPAKEASFTFYAWPVDKSQIPSEPRAKASPAPNDSSSAASGTGSADEKAEKGTSEGEAQASQAKEVDEEKETEKDPEEKDNHESPKTESLAVASPVMEAPSSTIKPKLLFIYACPSSSPVRSRMLYSSTVRSTMRDAQDRVALEVDKKIEVSEVEDLTETYLRSELFPKPAMQSGFPRPAPSKTPNRSNSAQSALSPGYRPLPMPGRATSQDSTPDPTLAASPGNGGSLPDSAFSMFGPRINVGSPGGGGFARPRPAAKR